MAVAFATTPFEASTLASASAYSKARAINVAAGSLLFCVTMQVGSANTCTSVTDTLGNTWIKAVGPITAPAGDSSDTIYGWYAKNSSAGANTITANWSGSTNGAILIGEVTGLAGGGTLDQALSGNVYTASSFQLSCGTSATLAQAAEAAVMFFDYSTGGPLTGVSGAGWTSDSTPNWFNFDTALRQITTATTAIACKVDEGSNSPSFAGLAMFFKDAPAGGTAVNPGAGSLAITGYAPAITQSASVSVAPGVGNLAFTGYAPTVARTVSLITPVLKNNTGTVLASESGVVVNIYDTTTGALVVRKTGQTSDASGIVTVRDALLVAGTTYAYEVVLASNGRRLPTAAVS